MRNWKVGCAGTHASKEFNVMQRSGPAWATTAPGNQSLALASAHHQFISPSFHPCPPPLSLLNCMRAKMLPPDDSTVPGVPGVSGAMAAAAAAGFAASPFVPLRPRNAVFECAFEPRAFAVLEEAIGRGLLPKFDPDAPLVMDMRRLPPVVAEVYVLHILQTLDRRAKRKAAEAEAAAKKAALAGMDLDKAAGVTDRMSMADRGLAALAGAARPRVKDNYHHSITLLVPPFNPDLVKWPSYLERIMNRYTDHVSAVQAVARSVAQGGEESGSG